MTEKELRTHYDSYKLAMITTVKNVTRSVAESATLTRKWFNDALTMNVKMYDQIAGEIWETEGLSRPDQEQFADDLKNVYDGFRHILDGFLGIWEVVKYDK